MFEPNLTASPLVRPHRCFGYCILARKKAQSAIFLFEELKYSHPVSKLLRSVGERINMILLYLALSSTDRELTYLLTCVSRDSASGNLFEKYSNLEIWL